ncbi:MAG: hypothetical protein ABIH85_02365, partial [Candidatus Omnitrophota bacterium]
YLILNQLYETNKGAIEFEVRKLINIWDLQFVDLDELMNESWIVVQQSGTKPCDLDGSWFGYMKMEIKGHIYKEYMPQVVDRAATKSNFKTTVYRVKQALKALSGALSKNGKMDLYNVDIAKLVLKLKEMFPNEGGGWKEEKVTHSLVYMKTRDVSLSETIGGNEDGGPKVEDTIKDEKAGKRVINIENKNVKTSLLSFLRTLPVKEECILRMFIGIDDDKEWSCAKIKHVLGVAEEEIKSIKEKFTSMCKENGWGKDGKNGEFKDLENKNVSLPRKIIFEELSEEERKKTENFIQTKSFYLDAHSFFVLADIPLALLRYRNFILKEYGVNVGKYPLILSIELEEVHDALEHCGGVKNKKFQKWIEQFECCVSEEKRVIGKNGLVRFGKIIVDKKSIVYQRLEKIDKGILVERINEYRKNGVNVQERPLLLEFEPKKIVPILKDLESIGIVKLETAFPIAAGILKPTYVSYLAREIIQQLSHSEQKKLLDNMGEVTKSKSVKNLLKRCLDVDYPSETLLSYLKKTGGMPYETSFKTIFYKAMDVLKEIAGHKDNVVFPIIQEHFGHISDSQTRNLEYSKIKWVMRYFSHERRDDFDKISKFVDKYASLTGCRTAVIFDIFFGKNRNFYGLDSAAEKLNVPRTILFRYLEKIFNIIYNIPEISEILKRENFGQKPEEKQKKDSQKTREILLFIANAGYLDKVLEELSNIKTLDPLKIQADKMMLEAFVTNNGNLKNLEKHFTKLGDSNKAFKQLYSEIYSGKKLGKVKKNSVYDWFYPALRLASRTSIFTRIEKIMETRGKIETALPLGMKRKDYYVAEWILFDSYKNNVEDFRSNLEFYPVIFCNKYGDDTSGIKEQKLLEDITRGNNIREVSKKDKAKNLDSLQGEEQKQIIKKLKFDDYRTEYKIVLRAFKKYFSIPKMREHYNKVKEILDFEIKGDELFYAGCVVRDVIRKMPKNEFKELIEDYHMLPTVASQLSDGKICREKNALEFIRKDKKSKGLYQENGKYQKEFSFGATHYVHAVRNLLSHPKIRLEVNEAIKRKRRYIVLKRSDRKRIKIGLIKARKEAKIKTIIRDYDELHKKVIHAYPSLENKLSLLGKHPMDSYLIDYLSQGKTPREIENEPFFKKRNYKKSIIKSHIKKVIAILAFHPLFRDEENVMFNLEILTDEKKEPNDVKKWESIEIKKNFAQTVEIAEEEREEIKSRLMLLEVLGKIPRITGGYKDLFNAVTAKYVVSNVKEYTLYHPIDLEIIRDISRGKTLQDIWNDPKIKVLGWQRTKTKNHIDKVLNVLSFHQLLGDKYDREFAPKEVKGIDSYEIKKIKETITNILPRKRSKIVPITQKDRTRVANKLLNLKSLEQRNIVLEDYAFLHRLITIRHPMFYEHSFGGNMEYRSYDADIIRFLFYDKVLTNMMKASLVQSAEINYVALRRCAIKILTILAFHPLLRDKNNLETKIEGLEELLAEKREIPSENLESAKVVANDMFFSKLKKERYYEVRYNENRLIEYQRALGLEDNCSPIETIRHYINMLKVRANDPDNVHIGVGNKNVGLISVICYEDKTKEKPIGRGIVNIEGDLCEQKNSSMLQKIDFISLLNMAFAASNIREGTSYEKMNEYEKKFIQLIQSECKFVAGMDVPENNVLEFIKNLPSSKWQSVEKIRDYFKIQVARIEQAV